MSGGRSKGKKMVIYICAGDACKEHKSKKLRARLEALVEERGVSETVAIAKCGCLGQCKRAVTALIQPGEKVLKDLKPKHAGQVLDEAAEA